MPPSSVASPTWENPHGFPGSCPRAGSMNMFPVLKICLGKFSNDRNTWRPNPGITVYLREIVRFYGPTIEVSEFMYLPGFVTADAYN